MDHRTCFADFARYCSLNVLGMLALSCYILADTFFVGQTGDPLEAVDRAKQRRISRTAQYYCLTHGYGETTPCRFDVAAVLGTDGEVRLVKHAFEFQG